VRDCFFIFDNQDLHKFTNLVSRTWAFAELQQAMASQAHLYRAEKLRLREWL